MENVIEYMEEPKGDAKELLIYCPKVTVKIERTQKVMWDITRVFDDWEEGKVMGRKWVFER